MKLIDILVEELPKNGGWLRDVKTMTQDRGGDIWGYDCVSPCLKGGLWSSKSGENLVRTSKIEVRNLAADWNTAIITREQYEAALAAKNEGWIYWPGGECPVPTGTLVDVKWRDGRIDDGIPAKISHDLDSSKRNAISWQHHGNSHDIIAYHLHKPQEAELAEADDEADLNECIGQDAVPVWNGEGLPPVGCECECQFRGGWQKCTILFCGKQIVVAMVNDDEYPFESKGSLFRPIRSEADRKRDAAVGKIFDVICKSLTDESESTSFAIYEAIAAGEIPGVRLED